ncbi:DEHA2G11539p protein [Puccinia sorghi]|uniref:DEHA2G11539p protein n=1 Tax=Puccinia sorghi TaxID=27349 RepID=A0A0L6VUQ7_9BASI|nr:DEHA2G11539p protein [Puccinia sorghi]
MSIPYHTWTGRSVNWEVLCPFGCLTYSLIPKENSNFKLTPTAERGIMLGYENDFSSYHIFKLDKKKVVCVQDVKFEKFSFPGWRMEDTTEDQDASNIFDIPKNSSMYPETISFTKSQNLKAPNNQVKTTVIKEIPKAPRDINSYQLS